jgi:hypothetical protein
MDSMSISRSWPCVCSFTFRHATFHLGEGQGSQVLCLLGLVKCTVRETSCDQRVYISIFLIASSQLFVTTSRLTGITTTFEHLRINYKEY